MSRKRFTPEQIITMLREAEVLLSQGAQVADVWRKLGISEQSYYRWRKEYGGMRIDQAKRLKELEQVCEVMGDLRAEGLPGVGATSIHPEA